jgi:hypothetical protein
MLSCRCILPLSLLDDNLISSQSWKIFLHLSIDQISHQFLENVYSFFMVTLFSYLKSTHNLKVSSLLFKKITREPQCDTLGRIYPFFNNSSSCICNSFNYGVPILCGLLDTVVAPSTKSIEKSMSLFGGNSVISPKKYSKYLKTRWYICFTLYLWIHIPYGIQKYDTPS